MPSEDQRMAHGQDMTPEGSAPNGTQRAAPSKAQPNTTQENIAQQSMAQQRRAQQSRAQQSRAQQCKAQQCKAQQCRTQPDAAPGSAQQGTILGLRSAWRHAGICAPLHPIFVHFSIALTTSSFGFDLLGYFIGHRVFLRLGWWLLAASLAATVFTLASGVVSRMHSKVAEGAARSFLRLHMALGPLFFGLLLTQAIWRALLWQQGAISGLYLVAMGGVMLVMLLQGYLGGEMVYRFGLAVAPERQARKATIARPAIREGRPS